MGWVAWGVLKLFGWVVRGSVVLVFVWKDCWGVWWLFDGSFEGFGGSLDELFNGFWARLAGLPRYGSPGWAGLGFLSLWFSWSFGKGVEV